MVKPHGLVHEALNGSEVVGDQQYTDPVALEPKNAIHALTLEGGIANGQNFIYDENLWMHVNGNGEPESRMHAR